MRQLADWLDGYLEYTDNTEPHELYRKWTGISIIASAMKRKCYFPYGRNTWYPNFYIILVGAPGRTRKSTSLQDAERFLSDSRMGIRLASNKLSPEQLIKEVAESAEMYQFKNGTIMNHCSLTVLASEFVVFLRHRQVDFIGDLTDLYDCSRNWKYSTKHFGRDDIAGVWLNILGGTTPTLIQTAIPVETIGGGFMSRIIFVYADRKGKTVPDSFITPEVGILENKLFHDLEQISMLGGAYRPTEKYVAEFSGWYMEHDQKYADENDDRIGAYYARKAATASKLAMVLSASRHDELIVNERDFTRAIELLNEVEVPMWNTFKGLGKSMYADTMPRVMDEIAKLRECTIDYLLRKMRADITHFDLARILDTLEAMKFCSYFPGAKKVVYNSGFGRHDIN